MTLYIHGVGHFHPPNVIDNSFLEALQIEVDGAWVKERVGISERHTVLSLDYIEKTHNKEPYLIGPHIEFSNAETSVHAINMALERAQLQPAQIGMVIAGSCSPEYSLPADACAIAAKLNLKVPTFDINSACTTFVSHLYVINNMESESLPDYILLVIPDNTTRHINYSDRRTAVLWGDCSTAIIVSKKIKSNLCIEAVTTESNPLEWKKIILPAGGYFYQDGNAVQRFAIKQMIATTKKMMDKAHLQPGQYYFIGHQANLRILENVCEKLQIPSEKHRYNIDQFGNCGAAGAPSVLSQNWERFKSGDIILMTMVGAGLSWGGIIIRVT